MLEERSQCLRRYKPRAFTLLDGVSFEKPSTNYLCTRKPSFSRANRCNSGVPPSIGRVPGPCLKLTAHPEEISRTSSVSYMYPECIQQYLHYGYIWIHMVKYLLDSSIRHNLVNVFWIEEVMDGYRSCKRVLTEAWWMYFGSKAAAASLFLSALLAFI